MEYQIFIVINTYSSYILYVFILNNRPSSCMICDHYFWWFYLARIYHQKFSYQRIWSSHRTRSKWIYKNPPSCMTECLGGNRTPCLCFRYPFWICKLIPFCSRIWSNYMTPIICYVRPHKSHIYKMILPRIYICGYCLGNTSLCTCLSGDV